MPVCACRVLAPLRHADRLPACLLTGEDRKRPRAVKVTRMTPERTRAESCQRNETLVVARAAARLILLLVLVYLRPLLQDRIQ
jgi:hypothetical protein